ncbi:alanyl-tRNA editing protein [Natrarchaeobaculum aegyptiacum]|uniref:Alanyl-transfer RNA synthetases family profile domain-containing protein n=1 Tax=Natrarchaeobaculum aegyptiacum TaxID=745377 RepID=A0A2Z2HSP1_9EURY|nr:alanyl-tRNA editing protein [Natrarchaeobaculum aegyptiacum]ARS89105.1 hypothetical protein B1756_04585 [Natrarchaeobaculum aegyptiacum]
MSGQRAAAEPYTTRFQTAVTSIDGRRVWLERSYFYAESGGQPADRGQIDDVRVEDVRVEDGEPVHYLAEEPSFKVGHRVLCSIDWEYRMYCMRAHTASHVLYGAGRRLFDELSYAGFDIGDEKVRVDLETQTEVDDETLIELEEAVNRVVWESRPVSWDDHPVAEVREREDVAFNEATEEGAFAKGRVRLVTIGGPEASGNGGSDGPTSNGSRLAGGATVTVAGKDNRNGNHWDVAACGGTHVRNTREIGPVTVLERSNPGEGVTRVEFAVGPPGIERRSVEKRAVFDAKRLLGTGISDVPGALERLSDDRDALSEQLRSRERDLVAARLEGEKTVEREDEQWLVATVGDLPADVTKDVVDDRLTDTDAAVVVALGGGDSTYAVVGSTGSRSATAVVDELTETFGGGGGGDDRLAQGGGFGVPPAEMRRSLE